MFAQINAMEEKAIAMMSDETKDLKNRIERKREFDLIPAFNIAAEKECGDLFGVVAKKEPKC